MADLSKSAVADACRHRLTGHGPRTVQRALLSMADFVDPHLAMDVYGQGASINRFEEKIAAFLGKEAAVFMPSGTMAQQIALRIWADRSGRDTIGMHPTCHLFMHENDAYAALHRLRAVLIGEPTRQLVPADLDPVKGPLGSLLVELPQRHNGGTLPSWDELVAMRDWSRGNGAKFHLDGARLWEARQFYQRPEAEIAALFDSVYVSFYKGLGGIGGAMLLGSASMADEARIWLRRHGGNLIHLFPLVAAAEQGFERHHPRMDAYAARARELAQIIASLAHLKVTPAVPQTNMMHVSFDRPQAEVEQAALETAAETGLWILGSLWTRPFAAKTPVFELTVGEATMAAGLELASLALRRLNDRLDKKS